ncbi:MAG TPA: polysaccharide biosynthesis/export family protein [Chitinophagaceae bacterium]|nr:polysaccharide biosynthesis/export family protein [Chitinophagaceae bacterium]
MLRTLYLFIIVLLIICGGISCANSRKFAYFSDVKDTSFKQQLEEVAPIHEHDILGITVSSRSADASAIFNMPSNSNDRSTTATGTYTEAGGYLVADDGTIQMPILGSIKAAGLTKQQLKDKITNLILGTKMLVDPIVEIRFLNFEVTVLGEVAHPTVITVPNEKISVLKAIGLAGDLTIYGKRDNVLLIREDNGKTITRHINLNSSDFFNSPYYYLQPNDVIYVQPNKAKVATGGRTEQLLPVIVSSLSIVAIILDRVIK